MHYSLLKFACVNDRTEGVRECACECMWLGWEMADQTEGGVGFTEAQTEVEVVQSRRLRWCVGGVELRMKDRRRA